MSMFTTCKRCGSDWCDGECWEEELLKVLKPYFQEDGSLRVPPQVVNESPILAKLKKQAVS